MFELFRSGAALCAAVILTLSPSAYAASATPNAANQPSQQTTLGVQVGLPPYLEPTVTSLAALASSGQTVLGAFRADSRSLAIRTALTSALLNAGATIDKLQLDKDHTDTSLGELALLCAPRKSYVQYAVSSNYLNTLVQSINAVSGASTDSGGSAAGGTGGGASSPLSSLLNDLKIIFATSAYKIADKVMVDPASVTTLEDKTSSACASDLAGYAQAYYGAKMPTAAATAEAAPALGAAGDEVLGLLGPTGVLIKSVLTVLQPIFNDVAQQLDKTRRYQAIENALDQNDGNVKTTGEKVATAIDENANASRLILAGQFVEQLVQIRETVIDLSGVEDCKTLAPSKRLPSNAPDSSFIGCWGAAWIKLEPQVTKLTTIGDSYDKLADTNISMSATATHRFDTILANYNNVKNASIPFDFSNFFAEMTEFVNFANNVASAVSASNINKLKSEPAAVTK